MEQPLSPRAEYERRRAVRQHEIGRLRIVDDRVGSVGLWSASATVVVLLVSFFSALPAAWALVPVAVLILARIIHLRYEAAIEVHAAAVRHYERGLARMDDRSEERRGGK